MKHLTKMDGGHNHSPINKMGGSMKSDPVSVGSPKAIKLLVIFKANSDVQAGVDPFLLPVAEDVIGGSSPVAEEQGQKRDVIGSEFVPNAA